MPIHSRSVAGFIVPLLSVVGFCTVGILARADGPPPAADQPPFSGFSAAKDAAGTGGSQAVAPEDHLPGWLGLAVDDSLVPGRLVVVEVDPRGPAARSGIRLQDMVLAIDGEPTLDAERFAAAVSAIAVGDKPRLSIGRGGTVEDVTLVATEAPRRPETDASAGGNAAGGAGSGRSTGADAGNGSIAIEEPSAFGRKPLPPPDVVIPSPLSGPAGPLAGPAGGAVASPVPSPSPSLPSAAVTATPPAAFPAFPDRTAGPTAGQPVPDRDIRPQTGEASRSKTALGVRTVPVDTASQVRFSLPEPTGALVVGLVDDFPASRAGLPTGSVIVALDRQPVRSPMELTRLVNEAPIDRPVKLEYVLPGGTSGAAEVSLVSVPTAASPGSLADDPTVRDEIRQLRATLESIARRIEELERRTGGTR